MKLQLLTDRTSLSERLRELDLDITAIDNAAAALPGAILITDAARAPELLGSVPSDVVVLSDAPSYDEGASLLPLGIRAYANTYIHRDHLEQLLTSVESGNVWLYPEFMQQLILQATGTSSGNEKVLEKLTERERETALLVKKGLSNKEIAIELTITERTVKQHLTHIFEKLDVHDRLSLAMLLS